MARILAIDYGVKRTGIAVTDELQLIASGLTTVSTQSIFSFLKEYINNEQVEKIIVGKPLQMNNMPSESEVYIAPFIEKIQKLFPTIPIERIDERFTSKMAMQTMIAGGLKQQQRRKKTLLDQISATIILQSYLEQKSKI